MNKEVIIIGASGHGKVVADIVLKSNDRIIGFLDDNENIKEFIGYRVLGKTSDYIYYPNVKFVVAIGNSNVRERLANLMKDKVSFYTGIHPSSQISSLNVTIGEGTVVMANAVINSGATIGKHCIINTGAVVEHDNIIGDFTHVSVGTKLGGSVEIGKSCWLGIGATISNNIRIASNSFIGAGAVVVKDIIDSGLYVGIPAKEKMPSVSGLQGKQ